MIVRPPYEERLLKAPTWPDYADERGRTALSLAAEGGRLEAIHNKNNNSNSNSNSNNDKFDFSITITIITITIIIIIIGGAAAARGRGGQGQGGAGRHDGALPRLAERPPGGSEPFCKHLYLK